MRSCEAALLQNHIISILCTLLIFARSLPVVSFPKLFRLPLDPISLLIRLPPKSNTNNNKPTDMYLSLSHSLSLSPSFSISHHLCCHPLAARNTQDLGHAMLLAHAQPVLLAAVSQSPIPLSRQVSHLSLSAAQLTAGQVYR